MARRARNGGSDGWDLTVDALMNGLLDEDDLQREFAEFAIDQRNYALYQNTLAMGRPPTYETYVDGGKGRSEFDVSIGGQIIYEFNLLDDILAWIGEQLILRSPIGEPDDKRPGHPGLYRESHIFLAGDTVMPIPAGEKLPPAEKYWFVNTTPYARKIEKPRAQSDQAAEGVYETVADDARRKFGKLLEVRYTFKQMAYKDADQGQGSKYRSKRELVDDAMAKGAGRHKALQVASRIMKRQKANRQPAILILPGGY
jgi:hypothetical protein